MTSAHATLRFDRALAAPPPRVWQALADPEARIQWGPPSPEINMAFIEADFRPGGRDLCRCGPGPAEGMEVLTLYHLVEPERLIVFTEVIGPPGGPDSTALVTAELTPDATGTALAITLQAASFGPEDMTVHMNEGWSASLDNLKRFVEA